MAWCLRRAQTCAELIESDQMLAIVTSCVSAGVPSNFLELQQLPRLCSGVRKRGVGTVRRRWGHSEGGSPAPGSQWALVKWWLLLPFILDAGIVWLVAGPSAAGVGWTVGASFWPVLVTNLGMLR